MAQVLVVDDDLDIREAIGGILKEEGHEVVSAANGAEALEKIAERKPDVMLLDLMMPVMSGWEVLHALRRSDVQFPVLILSALADGTSAYQIRKPISLDQLLKLIDAVTSGGAPSGKWWFKAPMA